MSKVREALVGTHWGNFEVTSSEGHLVSVRPVSGDSNPAGFGSSILDAFDPDVRIGQPMVRSGWLRNRNGAGRGDGRGAFVSLSWPEALDLAAGEIDRVRRDHGNRAIFGGSYGWSSAGRFHHAQSQLHRFLNVIGGYVRSVNTYSAAAAEVIVPYIFGLNPLTAIEPNYEDIVAHSQLVVAFGGLCLRNNQVVPGGVACHTDRCQLEQARDRGVEIVNIGPMRDDVPDFLPQTWVPCRPATDTAVMLGMAYTLVEEGLHDIGFLKRFCVGYERFEAYLMGLSDGQPKTPEWAASKSGVAAGTIRDLARRMSAVRTVVTVSLSLQRAEHGEQPYWMAAVLAAMLGQIGLPGGGVGFAWGSNGRGYFGRRRVNFSWGKFDQGRNRVREFIPVARIADMLLHPGEQFDYNGSSQPYPDAKLVYWAGGNPFHHHQDLFRLSRAWEQPETVIVNESVWTATARRADIVFPATTFLERNDVVCGLGPTISPNRQADEPFAQARNDYDIFAGLAARLGVEDVFTEGGRDEKAWLHAIYDESRSNAAERGIVLPPFDEFWQGSGVDVSAQLAESIMPLARFRADPVANPLPTASGRIEIFSETIDAFAYPDCPGHPVWLEKQEWLGAARAVSYPLHMLSPQPSNRLHSQFDFGRASKSTKIGNREPALINPADAAQRGIAEGDIVRIYNDRGGLLAGAVLTDSIAPNVVQVATGSWFSPHAEIDGLELHGNPNAVSIDIGTSSLAQGPSAQSCLVEIERYQGVVPPVAAFSPPLIEQFGVPGSRSSHSKPTENQNQ